MYTFCEHKNLTNTNFQGFEQFEVKQKNNNIYHKNHHKKRRDTNTKHLAHVATHHRVVVGHFLVF